jgi:hypothetical protein
MQFNQDQIPLSGLQSQNLVKEFDVDDWLALAISHKYNLFFNHIVFLMFQPLVYQMICWYGELMY